VSKGHVAKVCDCRDPETGKRLGKACPKRSQSRHGSWMFVVGVQDATGQRRQVHRQGFATKTAAEAELERLVGKVRDGVSTDDKLTVGQWLDVWLDGKTSASGVSGVGAQIRLTTARSYAAHTRLYLKPTLGHIALSKLRPEHISLAYQTILKASATPAKGRRPMGPATLRRVHATFASALSAAVKARRIDRNPADHVDLPTVVRSRVQPWTPEELGTFLDSAASDPLGGLFELMAATGLRRGEAVGLRWSDVDLERGVLTVRQQAVQLGADQRVPCAVCGDGHRRVTFGPPKTAAGENRGVALGGHAVGALLAQQIRQAADRERFGDAYVDHDLVFAWDHGMPLSPDAVTTRFARLAKDAGLRHVRLHDLRHGAASLMLSAGIPMGVVSKRLGHSQVSLTMDLYSHLLPETDRLAAEATEDMIPRRQRYGFVTAQGPETSAGGDRVG